MKRQNGFSLLGIGLLALCLMLGSGPAAAIIVDDGAGAIKVWGDNTDPITTADDTTVTVNTGATLTTAADAITFTGDNNAVVNNGAITATGGNAITVTYDNDAATAQNHAVTNYGAITGVSGISFCTDPDLYPNEAGVANSDVVNNYGTIEATGAYVAGGIESVERPAAVEMGEGNDLLNNYAGAEITGSVLMGPGNDQLFNWGAINSTYGPAVETGDGSDTMENAGTITIEESDQCGISTGDGNDTFVNTGTVNIGATTNAGFSMGDGIDTFTNSGVITMEDINTNGVVMADGNDTFTNSGTIEIEYARVGALSMGGGDDTFTNSGTILLEESGQDHGMAFGCDDDTLVNTGTIEIGKTYYGGISMGNGNDTFDNAGTISLGEIGRSGISMAHGNDTFTNSGTITIDFAGARDDGYGGGINIGGGGDCSPSEEPDDDDDIIDNDLFTNTATGIITINDAYTTGINTGPRNDTFVNAGAITIRYAGDAGINMGSGNDTFDNTGTIRIDDAGTAGISLGAGHDVFTNAGTIEIGDTGSPGINLGCSSADEDTDNDIFTNTGTIKIDDAGTVGINMGNYGDDTFTNSGDITIGYATNNAINMGEYGDDTFTNSGTITVEEAGKSAIMFGEESGIITFDNSGTITIGSTGQAAIHFADNGYDTFTNTGTISIATGYGEYVSDDAGIAMGKENDVLDNSGTLEIGAAYKGIVLGPGSDDLLNTGTLLIGYTEYDGIVGGPGNDLIDNSGSIEIVKSDEHGIIMSDNHDTITNTGTITIGQTYNGAIAMSEGQDTITNSGTIAIGTVESGAGISMGTGKDTLTNTGTITIDRTESNAGISMGDGEDVFTNEGTITIDRTENSGISLGQSGDTFTNSGTITINEAGDAGINLACSSGDGDDTFVNTGTITIGQTLYPGIALGDGNDTFDNTGTITMGRIGLYDADGYAAITMGDGADTLTNSGTLDLGDGPRPFIMAGPDADTVINEGTIDGGIIMGQDNDEVVLRTGSTVTGDIDGKCDDYATDGMDIITLEGAGVQAGDIIRFETLAKTGDGIWTVNGLVTVDDNVNVEAGTLWLNDDLTPHDDGPLSVTVDAGATLGAGGITIDGNVVNAGALDLGVKLRHTTITGDYTNGAGATTAVALFDTGAVTHLTVEGTAAIEGGTLLVTPVGVLQDGTTYTVLTTGTLNGIFDEATANSMVLSFEMDDETVPNSILLETDRQSYAAALAGAGLTGNQSALSNSLMELIDTLPTGDLADLINALDRQPDAASLASAMNQLSPELYTMGTALTGLSTGGFTSGMTGRLSDLRTAATNRATEAGPALAVAPAGSRGAGSGWSPWAKAFYTTAEQDATAGFNGYSYDAMGLGLGIDKGMTDNLVMGVSLGMSVSEADADNNRGEVDVDSMQVGLYGSWSAEKIYMDGALIYGTSSFDSLRPIPLMGVTAIGDHDGTDYGAYVGGGYKAAMGDWNVIPTLSLQYTCHEEDAFVETGAGVANLSVAAADTDSLLSRLGVRVNRLFQVGDGMDLMPEASLQWGHEFSDTDQQAMARFAGTTTGFTVTGVDADADSALAGLGVNAFMGDALSLSVFYEGEFRDGFEGHTIEAGLRYMF